MNQTPTCNTKNDKTLRRQWEKPHDTDFVSDPLDMTPEAEATKQKQTRFIQMLGRHAAEGAASRAGRQPIRMRESVRESCIWLRINIQNK